MPCRAHARCYYCDAALAPQHEHDHYPVPKRHGGTEKVPACVNCHALKDRTPLDEWPLDLFAAAHRALAEANDQPGPVRLLLAKISAIGMDAAARDGAELAGL